MKGYDHRSAESIFAYSKGLLHRSLSDAVLSIDPDFCVEDITIDGKGALGQLVEKFYFGYEPNSDPGPDFKEANLELKTTPLKILKTGEYAIKERLVCDMIDYCEIVNHSFEDSLFYKKSLLMLIIFYLHISGVKMRDLEFIYSVLWRLQDKDLLIIKQDYYTIINKIKAGKAHEISEGDTYYLAACRKGQKGDALRKQPFNAIGAPKRAFSLKPSYMRTILDFVRDSGSDMATNTDIQIHKDEIVSAQELQTSTFEQIITSRLLKQKGKDYRQIAQELSVEINSNEKSRYPRVISEWLKPYKNSEEFSKAGIRMKTIRVEASGKIRESMSFENIDYKAVAKESKWTQSKWYDIISSRFLFVVFKESTENIEGWENEKRYVLDNVFFWTMPVQDYALAQEYWKNIKENIKSKTLENDNNTFWKESLKKNFHVRPKAQNSADKYLFGKKRVPKKAYWFNKSYVLNIIKANEQGI